MNYDYIASVYGYRPEVGRRVRHTETGKFGVIKPEPRTQQHYVQVQFEGQNFNLPCHPKAIEYADAVVATRVALMRPKGYGR